MTSNAVSAREIALAEALLEAAKELRRLEDAGYPVDARVMETIESKTELAMVV